MIQYFSKYKMLIGISVLIVICVLVFNVFYFSIYYGFVQVNYINSLLLVPFIVLILSFGIILGRSKPSDHIPLLKDTRLTSREKEIIALIVQGKKNIEIADNLYVELSTIKTHINNIYKKLKVSNRTQIKERYSQ